MLLFSGHFNFAAGEKFGKFYGFGFEKRDWHAPALIKALLCAFYCSLFNSVTIAVLLGSIAPCSIIFLSPHFESGFTAVFYRTMAFPVVSTVFFCNSTPRSCSCTVADINFAVQSIISIDVMGFETVPCCSARSA